MTHRPPRLPLLGAYAMAPADDAARAAFHDGLAGLEIGGLEVPVLDRDAPQMQLSWFRGVLQPSWDVLLTCIPTVMARLADAPAHGLASTDEDARAAALADAAVARDLAVRLADAHGRRRVVAVQVHSAPGPRLGSADALARSLETLAGWDWAGAEVLVEHCDALVTGQRPNKGFLSLADELGAVARVAGTARGPGLPAPTDGPVGVSVNWGRSAIEGRSARTPVEHVTAAREAGLLRAVVLSGATDVASPWGPPWTDTHIPPSGTGALAASGASLLDATTAREVLAAAGPEVLRAVKVSVRPDDADVATRLAVARAAVDLARHPGAGGSGPPHPDRATATGAATGSPGPATAAAGADVPRAPRPGPAVGVVGLGVMGAPMAGHVLRAGFPVHVTARRPDRAERLVTAGATWHATARELAGRSDVVLLMVPDLPDVEAVLEGPDGLIAGAGDRRIVVVVSSTVSPQGLQGLAARVVDRTEGRVTVVDAPVSGGEEGAVAGTLSIMVGGDDTDVARVRPVLAATGNPVHLGGLGAGQVAKACNQMIVAATVLALGEAVVVAERAGLDVATLLDLLGGGFAGSRLLEVKKHRFATHDHSPSGPARFMVKDLGFATDAAAASGTATPQLDVNREAFTALTEAGLGDLDTAVVQRWVESLRRG